ncbi:MAG: alpha/beta fold hydrolase [Actinomycetota bacterium]
MPVADLGDIQLHYRSFGDGPPVLGIMGFGLDQRYWAGQVPAVAESNRFITFDNRGSGRSSRVPATSIDEMADDAVRLLDHLEIEKTVVFGASMGGTIAQRLVLDHPERVSALILAITWARPLEFMRRRHHLARVVIEQFGPEEFTDLALLWMFTPQFFEFAGGAIDQMVASLQGPGGPEMMRPEELLAQLDALDKHDVLGELSTVGCPTLVVTGRMDIMVPAIGGREIAETIPGAEHVEFETGHGLMIEEMDAFNATIRGFLDRVT